MASTDPPRISISIARLENIKSCPERSKRGRDYLVTVARIPQEKLWQTRRGAYQHYQGDQRLRKKIQKKIKMQLKFYFVYFVLSLVSLFTFSMMCMSVLEWVLVATKVLSSQGWYDRVGQGLVCRGWLARHNTDIAGMSPIFQQWKDRNV